MVLSIDQENCAPAETPKGSFKEFTKKITDFIAQLFAKRKKKEPEVKTEIAKKKESDRMHIPDDEIGSEWM